MAKTPAKSASNGKPRPAPKSIDAKNGAKNGAKGSAKNGAKAVDKKTIKPAPAKAKAALQAPKAAPKAAAKAAPKPAPKAALKAAPKAESKAGAKSKAKADKPAPPLKPNKPRTDASSKIVHLIAEEMAIEEAELTANASFKEDLNLDEIDVAELLMQAETTFGVHPFNEEDWESCETVGDFCRLVERRIEAKRKK